MAPRHDWRTPVPEPPSTASSADSSARERTLGVIVALVTPLFGGGVDTKGHDAVTLIRGPSVRGQLRFWWRETHPSRNAWSGDLVELESLLWGSEKVPSPVVVMTDQPSQSPPRVLRADDNFGLLKNDPAEYALFSAREQRGKSGQPGREAKDLVAEGAAFRVTLRWPSADAWVALRRAANAGRKEKLPEHRVDLDAEVLRALTAWLHYGGLGGRTRRGCGAVQLLSIDAERTSLELQAVPLGERPALPGVEVFLGAPPSEPESSMRSWSRAVDTLRRFRQTGRGVRGREHDKSIGSLHLRGIPGRSKWPEPDSIRAITGMSLRVPGAPARPPEGADTDTHDHRTPITPAAVGSFPRAELGLPIVFHFQDGRGARHLREFDGRPGFSSDPPDTTLEAKHPIREQQGTERFGRMASPVITRPILLLNGKGDPEWRPAVIFLDRSKALASLEARLKGGRSHPVATSDIRGPKAAHAPPMKPLDEDGKPRPGPGHESALAAFKAYLVGTLNFRREGEGDSI
ncbi:MAG TPA: RAMP superfamily CRISPR-associated protein [Phycisphaerales bacterium]|nr:RAMP superfamily CRISPR-associated protein [Phycisphaerales bacterium]HMP38560.1 RAMP superfamily CRISPR-associated protein [Phycisphaerales bacterium]